MDNDTRGWIMCCVSGIACVVGASIICVDILIQYIPSKRNFRIQDSNVFLASSLSLSFGVMLFSALYSMLPSSKKYLIKSGFSPSNAAWILLAGFVAGFVGIQVVSRFLHHFMPSHVVDCDHTHKEEHSHNHSRRHSVGDRERSHSHAPHSNPPTATESTPLLPCPTETNSKDHYHTHDGPTIHHHHNGPQERRPSMIQVQKRVMSFVKDTKTDCDSNGPCFGYSDPCGQECFKHLAARAPTRHSSVLRTATGTLFHQPPTNGIIPEEGEHSGRARARSLSTRVPSVHSGASMEANDDSSSADDEDIEAQHHHHVPENAFMSIGLQTSIAIALHKLPEGFITYATNHANPSLGFSVFMALFIHNITEGFAMALPLYLALNNRGWAMFWASLLGGVSQPLGAGIAAAWFKIAGHEGHKPGATVYGCMFAVTAGIMASVALQLFVEGLSLNHNRNLCIAFAFIGMTIMGMSNALTS